MDHHADLFGAQTEHSCGVRVVNLLHDLHFEEVIPRSQTSHLPETSFERALAHLCRVRALDRSRVLAPLEVPVGVITALIGGPFFLWLLVRSSR